MPRRTEDPTAPVDLATTLSSVLRTLSIDASAATRDKLITYVIELSRWNTRINLTGAATPLAFIEGPLFDALTLLPVLIPAAPMVDIGSGGGLPGIPTLLISDQTSITLVEPRAKRAAFLRHAVATLDLHAEVETGRIEDIPEGAFNAAVAQAVFEPLEWIRRARRIVAPQGHIYVLCASPIPRTESATSTIDDLFECCHPKTGAKRFTYRLTR